MNRRHVGGKLGILAGGGDLPGKLIETCRQAGRGFHVIAIEGQAEATVIGDCPHDWVRLGAAQKALDIARREGLTEIVMAGKVTRPSIAALRPDSLAMKVLAKAGAAAMGDDGLLKAVVRQIEDFGFSVVGPDEILAMEAGAVGPLGRHAPDELATRDIARGVEVLHALGPADVGQAVAVQDGIVLAVEAIEGTDRMIKRCGALRREGPGGVLVKLPKPGQERRVDLPAVGPETVRRAAAAGLRGIAVDAVGTLFVDRDEVIRLADELGLFVFAIDGAEWARDRSSI